MRHHHEEDDDRKNNLLDPRHPNSPYNRYNFFSPYSTTNPSSPYYNVDDVKIWWASSLLMILFVPWFKLNYYYPFLGLISMFLVLGLMVRRQPVSAARLVLFFGFVTWSVFTVCIQIFTDTSL
jgi:hypothetical protein